MIFPIKEKLHLNGVYSPNYSVNGKTFYSKAHAVKECVQSGWEWPTFSVWQTSKQFSRPDKTFSEACRTQCEIISDHHKKVRLWYSGGRDSGCILEYFLAGKFKLDEIAVYRRYPGQKDFITNEYDKFKIYAQLKNLLQKYSTNIVVKHYDIMPTHLNYYSKNLEELYFPYSDLAWFGHGVHTPYECYLELQNDNFVNLVGHAFPQVDNNQFYWIDTNFNLNQFDPYTLNFFCDPRHPDLSVILAYQIYELQQNHADVYEQSFLKVKNKLKFPKNNTPLDTDWTAPDVTQRHQRWIMDRKDILYIANAYQTDLGTDTCNNFLSFYENFESKYSKYFDKGNIFHNWIGSISEKHTLVDI